MSVVGSRDRPRDLSRPLPAGLSWAVLAVFAVTLALATLIAPLPWWIAAVYAGMSVVTFAAYGLDKRAARSSAARTPESTLLLLGLLAGWPGALVAQQVFRHKTRKRSFRRAFWGTVVLNVLAVAALGWFLTR
ncbi:hypothetical protein GCM10022200_01460 [Microbacterium awajiense]|uniref:DUF1294 domain-containing protein n=1 Tax=Microbacterium awajiense TaxID=415214 RepID=A0ABP7A093_9MICO